ncbi:winged helix DNA-binding domain-containing protein [Micromonospora sp. CPCC 205561]|uniref:winged helix DNA-binding domain-containing protein n=1 Tax=Micromonospora sp. CPCC 205561 TaxID=3122407 RepID=UPI002FEFFB8B
MTDLTWPQVHARRLRRHALSAPAPGDTRGADGDPAGPATDRVAGVVSAICGAHAQIASAAELSVGLRVDGATRTTVREALWTHRTLIRTRGPRGTVHLLAAADLPMWVGALSALPVPTEAQNGGLLTAEQTEQVVSAVADALRDAELTTAELTEQVVARTGPWAGDRVMEAFQDRWPRWMAAMAVATRRGAMCSGPNRGRATTHTSPARWLPGFAPMAGRAALAELVRGYLHAYGPATPAHFAQWLSAPRRWAAELFGSLDLEQVTVQGAPGWVSAGDTDFPSDGPTGVWLLPYFDAYQVGCHPRERLFPGPAGERALARGQAGNYPVLLVDGTVAGVWHQRRSGRKIHVTVEPLGPLSPRRRRALEARVERIGEILEGTPSLTVGPVGVGPHA